MHKLPREWEKKKKKTGVELLVSCYIQASPVEESEIKKQLEGVCVCVFEHDQSGKPLAGKGEKQT